MCLASLVFVDLDDAGHALEMGVAGQEVGVILKSGRVSDRIGGGELVLAREGRPRRAPGACRGQRRPA
jgi:hypothetical protein